MNLPPHYAQIQSATQALGFTMASEPEVGALLRSLAATRPEGVFLELGTGTGLATSWMLDGMDKQSYLVSVDNDAAAQAVAREFLGSDVRLELRLGDGGEIIADLPQGGFDLIFADTWPGKYTHLEETLALLRRGGIYLIDDMLPQPNWPDGHAPKAGALVEQLMARDDFWVTKMDWASGVMVAVKR